MLARLGSPGVRLSAKRVLLELSPPSAVSNSSSQLSRVAPSPAVPGSAVRIWPSSDSGVHSGADTGTGIGKGTGAESKRPPAARRPTAAALTTRGARYEKTPIKTLGGGQQIDSGISSSNSQSTPTHIVDLQHSNLT